MIPSKYKTLAQAAKAASLLGIKTSTEYRLKFLKDPLLPYSPEKCYGEKWRGWPAFLGTTRKRQLNISDSHYATYSQARRAAIKLGIKSKKGYLLSYTKDCQLPSNPQEIYGAYWRDWETFLRRTKRTDRSKEIYKNILDASVAAQALGPKTAREYVAVYRNNQKLPSNPSKYYASWINWDEFLGTGLYKTLRQASAAAQELRISSARDYITRYRLDTKLPSTPYQYYDNWVSWNNFLGK